MEIAIIFLVILLWCVFIYIIIKEILKYYKNKNKFENNKSEFISDMYKMQNKWAKKGEFSYSSAINIIIESFNLPQEETQPDTEYGKSIIKKQIQESGNK